MDTVALTDTNGIYGLGFFLQVAGEFGVKPIVGAELRKGGLRAVSLVRDDEGYENMCQLITSLHCDEDFSLVAELRRRHRGLFILSDSQSVLAGTKDLPDVYAELIAGQPARATIRFAGEERIPVVATGDVHFVTGADYKLHRLLRAIHLSTKLARVPARELAHEGAWLRTPVQMAEAFSHTPEALRNAVSIASRCKTEWDFSQTVFPKSDLPDSFSTLKERCYQGARRRYGPLSPQVRKRIEYELSLIREKGFADYFLIVEDMVRRAPRTCGRGSAAASIVSYCLGITHVDPITHNLLFERFLNPGRKDMPDIDVDFPWDERDEIIDYVFGKYGEDRAAMVANHVSFRARAAIRETARVYGLTEAEIKRVTGRLKGIWPLDSGEDAVKTHPKFRGLDLAEPWPEVLSWAHRLEGIPRNLSVHCGGVVITPDKMSKHAAVEPAPKGVKILQWEKDQTEESGLVKIDLLGNRSLAVIRDTLGAVERNYGTRIDYADLNPLEDEGTMRLLAEGRTIGVFYVESPGMRQLQAKTGVGDFEHMVIHSSIIRPAANRFINEYVKRLKGAPYKPLHPALRSTLSETYGIMCYQEDVTKAAMAIAGFDVVKADDLRKALSKKKPFTKLAHYRREFYRGALVRGVSLTTIDRVWDMIMSFSGYSFCKPHSASFAMVSFKSAYLKAHYPAEFMAAVITNQGGYYSTFEYISEARRMGLDVLAPDINESDRAYTATKGEVRMGLMQLKGLSEHAIDEILEERRKGRFVSFDDFLKRTLLDPSDVRILIKAGCFDSVSGREKRPSLMWKLYLRKTNQDPGQDTLSLFDSGYAACPTAEEYDEATLLRHEIEVLGFLVSRHPLSLYARRLPNLNYVGGSELREHVGETVKTVGWLVTGKTVRTKDDEPMEFISFEDTIAIYETTVFPDAYRKFSHLVEGSRAYVLTGKVESDMGAIYLNVSDVELLEDTGEETAESESSAEAEGEFALKLASMWGGRHC
jgi:error-prone DNA polymerase